MKFMTPASVKNLPHYLAEDRRRSLMKTEEERFQEAKKNKEMAAEIGFKMLKATKEAKDQDDLFQRFDQIKAEYGGKVPPETMQVAAGLVQRFGQEKLAQEDRSMQMEDRNRKKFLENQTISDTNILGQIAGADIDKAQGGQGVLSSGGTEYDVPVQKQDLLGQLSGGGMLGYHGMQVDNAKAAAEAQRDANKDKFEREKWETEKKVKDALAKKHLADAKRTGTGKTGASTKITPKIEQEVFEALFPTMLSQSGITSEGGAFFRGKDVAPPEEVEMARQQAGQMTAQVVGLMEDGMGLYEAINAAQQQGQPSGNAFDELLAEVSDGDQQLPGVPGTDLLDSVIGAQEELFGGELEETTPERGSVPFSEDDVITVIDKKPVVRDKREGVLVYDDGKMRLPTKEENLEIRRRAQKGQLGSTKGWRYKTKFPNQKPIASPGQAPALPNLSGRM